MSFGGQSFGSNPLLDGDIRTREMILEHEALTMTNANFELIQAFNEQFPDYNVEDIRLMTLHIEIVEMVENNKQPKEEFLAKMKFRHDLKQAITEYTSFNKFEIYPSGSSITTMGTKNSDLDLTIVCPRAKCVFQDEKMFPDARSVGSFNVLRIIRAILIGTKHRNLIKSVEFVCGNIPILKMVSSEGIECDLAYTSDSFVSSLHNSYLLRHYCHIDERFPQLTALVKKWGSVTGVKNPKGGGFNSYGLTLLVLHFLQCGTFPPVLPNLQRVHPEAFVQDEKNPAFIDFRTKLSDIPMKAVQEGRTRKENHDLVSVLFLKFLVYYQNFDFKKFYLNIPNGSVGLRCGSRYDVQSRGRGYAVCIQDPFDGHNPARTARHLNQIKQAIAATIKLFENDCVPSLQQILSVGRFN